MKVKLLKRLAGPDGNFAPGTILDVPDPRAIELVSSASAIYAEAEPIETADVEQIVETTEAPRPRRGRPRKLTGEDNG